MNRFGPIVLAAAFLAFQPLPGSDESGESRVQRQEFFGYLDLTGDLKALETVQVTSPHLESKWTFVVSYLIPEGSIAQPGDLLAQFDIAELIGERLELEKRREDARIQIAQKQAEQEIEELDLILSLAQADKSYGVARLYADIEPQLLARSEAEKYRFEADQSELEIEKANERLQSREASARADLKVVQLEYDQAELELRRIRGDIERMSIRASSPGIVLYGDNTESEKVQVGDGVFRGWPVLMLPNMERLVVSARVFDVDFGLLRKGMEAEITFDAVPSRSFKGRVSRLPEFAKPVHRSSELNVFLVDFLLLEKDLSVMKPGMTARIRLPVNHGSGLVVDRAAVRVDSLGESYLVSGFGESIPCRVVQSNDRQALVEGDVEEGDVVLLNRTRQEEIVRGGVWIEVERQDIRFTVAGTGELKAAQSVSFRPPAVPHTWEFKIIQMAPEGERVEPGDTVLEFDPTEVLKTIRQEQAELEKVQRELEKTRASLQLQHQDLQLELEEAEVADEKATNKLSQAREFESSLKIREAELEAVLSHRRVELLGRKLAATKKASGLQLQILGETRGLHEYRIAAAQKSLDALKLKAPIPGLAIYVANWNNEKKTVGSQVHFHETVLSLPTLSTLMVKGQIGESDAGRVRVGQEVNINLDAIPEKTFKGNISQVSTIFRQPSRSRPVKVMDIEVSFEHIDLQRMRSEMVARLRISVDEFQDVLAIPLAAVEIERGESFVWVRGETGASLRRPVQLGKDNGILAVVESGLEEGESILGRHPEETEY